MIRSILLSLAAFVLVVMVGAPMVRDLFAALAIASRLIGGAQ